MIGPERQLLPAPPTPSTPPCPHLSIGEATLYKGHDTSPTNILQTYRYCRDCGEKLRIVVPEPDKCICTHATSLAALQALRNMCPVHSPKFSDYLFQ